MQNRHKGFLMSKNKKVDNVDIASGIDSFDELTTLISNSGLLPEHKELFSALCNMGSDLLQDIIELENKLKELTNSLDVDENTIKSLKDKEVNELKAMAQELIDKNTKIFIYNGQIVVLKDQFNRIVSVINKHIKNLEKNYGEDK